jgi:hypothetical protein
VSGREEAALEVRVLEGVRCDGCSAPDLRRAAWSAEVSAARPLHGGRRKCQRWMEVVGVKRQGGGERASRPAEPAEQGEPSYISNVME